MENLSKKFCWWAFDWLKLLFRGGASARAARAADPIFGKAAGVGWAASTAGDAIA
jgi:hypothetical protein